MIRLTILIAATALALSVSGQATASSTSSCASFKFKQNGISWGAKHIRKRGVSCKAARALIRSYARPRNCRFQAPCHISGYTCKTTNAHDSDFTETCTRHRRLVKWHGSYSSR